MDPKFFRKYSDLVNEAETGDDDLFGGPTRTGRENRQSIAKARWLGQEHPQAANDLEALRRLQESAEPFLKQLAWFSKYYTGTGAYIPNDALSNIKNLIFKSLPEAIQNKYKFAPEYNGQDIDPNKSIPVKKLPESE